MKIHLIRLLIFKDYGNCATAYESFHNKANNQSNFQITLLSGIHIGLHKYLVQLQVTYWLLLKQEKMR